MARTDILTKGSTIKLKAIGGANTEVEIPCVSKDFNFSKGKYATFSEKCHKNGEVYDRSTIPTFSEFDIDINGLPSDTSDTVRQFLFDASDLTGDFDVSTATGDKEFTIEVAFTDPNTNNIKIQGFVTEIKHSFVIDRALTMVFSFQQTKKPVYT